MIENIFFLRRQPSTYSDKSEYFESTADKSMNDGTPQAVCTGRVKDGPAILAEYGKLASKTDKPSSTEFPRPNELNLDDNNSSVIKSVKSMPIMLNFSSSDTQMTTDSTVRAVGSSEIEDIEYLSKLISSEPLSTNDGVSNAMMVTVGDNQVSDTSTVDYTSKITQYVDDLIEEIMKTVAETIEKEYSCLRRNSEIALVTDAVQSTVIKSDEPTVSGTVIMVNGEGDSCQDTTGSNFSILTRRTVNEKVEKQTEDFIVTTKPRILNNKNSEAFDHMRSKSKVSHNI